MKLTFLGVGSAFTLQYYQSNMLVDVPEGKLLIDCGSDARHSLAEIVQDLVSESVYRRSIGRENALRAGRLTRLVLLSLPIRLWWAVLPVAIAPSSFGTRAALRSPLASWPGPD